MPPDGWFIDADILGLYHVLHAARHSSFADVVSGLTDDFPVEVDMKDVEWMPLVAERDLAVLTKDARQRWRPAEQQAIMDNGMGIFALRARRSLTNWDQAQMVFRWWDRMEDAWDSTDRPFVFTLTMSRGLKRKL